MVDADMADSAEFVTSSAWRTSTIDTKVSICIVSCSDCLLPNHAIRAVCNALSPVALVQSVVLSTSADQIPGVIVVQVPEGTKLSKMRWFAPLIDATLFCICDPDLSVDETSCRVVLEDAIAESRNGRCGGVRHSPGS